MGGAFLNYMEVRGVTGSINGKFFFPNYINLS